MLGWTLNKRKSITGWTGHPRVHLPNKRLGKLDKLSHNTHNPDRLSQGTMQNTLNKRGCRSPKGWTSRAALRSLPRNSRIPKDQPSNKISLQTAMQGARQEAKGM